MLWVRSRKPWLRTLRYVACLPNLHHPHAHVVPCKGVGLDVQLCLRPRLLAVAPVLLAQAKRASVSMLLSNPFAAIQAAWYDFLDFTAAA
eukprot:2760146-Alexandrium_andersonii.AAC.1